MSQVVGAVSILLIALYTCFIQYEPRETPNRMSSALSRHTIWESEELVAYLHPRPWTPGTVILEQKSRGEVGGSTFDLGQREYLAMLFGARTVGHLLCERLGVHRCALVTRPHKEEPPQIRILPLHGLDADWHPHLAGEDEYRLHDPGYCTSKSGTRWTDLNLEMIQARIRTKLPSSEAPPNFTFLGSDPNHSGLFSRIVRGEEQQWRVWEDEGHVAFLTPFPNSPGLTVLVPRRPLTSDIFRLEEEDYEELVLAAKKVSKLLEEGLGAFGVGLIFEGFEIDYAHAKLIPLLAPPPSEESDLAPNPPPAQFFPIYPGYVTSEDGPEASKESLQEFFEKVVQL